MTEIVRVTAEVFAAPEVFAFPETMWPFDTRILSSVPAELLPDRDAIEALKYPWELLALLQQTMADRITATRIADSAKFKDRDRTILVGPVWIDEGATVYEGNKIEGPAYIGPNAIVGFNSLVRESFIAAGGSVGYTSEVGRSFVGMNTDVPHFNAVLDSMFGADVSFSGYSRTANERVDGAEISSQVGGGRVNT